MAYDLGTARGRVELDVRDLNRAATTFTQLGRSFVIFGGLMLAGFGYVVNKAAEFESSMSHIAAVTGATEDQLEKLRVKALQLGRDSAFGAKEVADSFVELAKAGFTAQEVLDGVGDAVVTLSAAGDFPIAESAEAMANMMRTFGLEAKDAVHVADLLAGAANASTLEISDLATSMKYVGGVAASLKIPIDDVVVSLAELGNNGIKGSTGGTALRKILLSLNPVSEKAAQQMKDLGIITEDGANAFFDSSGKAKPLSEIFQILHDKTVMLSDAEKVKAFNIMFGNRAVSSAIILSRGGADAFNKMNKEVGKTTALEVMNKRLDNLSGALKIFKSSVETAFIKAGTPLQENLKQIVHWLTQLVNWFGDLPKGVQKAILWFMLIIGILSVGAGIFMLTIGNIIRMVSLFKQLGGILSGLRTIVAGVTAVFRAFAVAAAANPVLLLIAAIVALIAYFVYLYFHSEKFRKKIDDIWHTFNDGWHTVVDFFQSIPGYVQIAWEVIKEKFAEGKDWVLDKLGAIVDWFKELPGRIGGFIGDVISGIVDWFAKLPGRIVDLLSQAGWALLGFFGKVLSGILGFLGECLMRLIAWGGDMAREAWNMGFKTVSNIVGWFATLPKRVWDTLVDLALRFIEWSVQFIAKVIEFCNNVFNAVQEWFSKLPGLIWGFLSDIFSRFVGWVGDMIGRAFDFASRFVNTIIDWLSQLPGKIWGFLTDILNRLWEWVSNGIKAAIEFGQGVVRGILENIQSVGEILSDIFNGIVNWIKQKAMEAYATGKSWASSLWNGIKDGLGIHSPSYIERAFFAMDKNTAMSVKNIRKTMKSLTGIWGDVQRSPDIAYSVNTSRKVLPPDLGGIVGPDGQLMGDGVKVYDIDVYNPTGETTENSIYTSMKKMELMGVTG